jgi:rhodanese-related sulfurtransferase
MCRRIIMKRKITLLSLVLALSLVLGSFQMVFADEEAVDPASVDTSGIQTLIKKNIQTEADLEKFITELNSDVAKGKYSLLDSQTLMSWVKEDKDMLVIDTMPQGWFDANHIPGAICSEAGDNGSNGDFVSTQKSALLKAAKNYSGKESVKDKKHYWNSKSKKWQTKKPSKKYWKKCTKKSSKHYGKKSYWSYKKVDVKDKTIVIYCGFLGCKRSHEAAKYLASQGYTKVYRYAGGMSAWVANALVDPANYPIMGTVLPE